MTWGEFKALVEGIGGVTDSMEIWYIDISFPEAKQLSVTPQGEGSNSIGISIT
jgi:hypothetical protein